MDTLAWAAHAAGGAARGWLLRRVRDAAARFRWSAPDERGGRPGAYSSVFERRTAAVLARLLPQAKWDLHERPAWLTYPPTGRRLELDFWCSALSLAVECDGIQHAVMVPAFHKTKAAFRAQRRRDRWKDRECARRGVILIRIPHTESLDEHAIESWLRDRLAENGFLHPTAGARA